MTTLKQASANRENARLSTGPKSDEGKRVVSANRISHGILSSRLLLEDERAEEFQALFNDLQLQLRPVGALELSLVEKIAVTLWRQRRLVKAETATVELDSNAKPIASVVEAGIGLSGWGGERFCTEDLEPPDQEQIDWCQALIAECEGAGDLNLKNLQEKAPLLFAQLKEDAQEDEKTISQYLVNSSIKEYTEEVVTWCRDELMRLEKRVKQYAVTIAMAARAKDMLNIPWSKLDTLSKYQSSLDNQLYKAMRALRETQEWRLKSIEVVYRKLNSEIGNGADAV